MKNLRIKQLVKDWWNYPVLNLNECTHFWSYQEVEKYRHRINIQIYVGIQDGVHVSGYSYKGTTFGGGCNPGRKWGEYPSKKAAGLAALEAVKMRFTSSFESDKSVRIQKAINAIDQSILFNSGSIQLKIPYKF